MSYMLNNVSSTLESPVSKLDFSIQYLQNTLASLGFNEEDPQYKKILDSKLNLKFLQEGSLSEILPFLTHSQSSNQFIQLPIAELVDLIESKIDFENLKICKISPRPDKDRLTLLSKLDCNQVEAGFIGDIHRVYTSLLEYSGFKQQISIEELILLLNFLKNENSKKCEKLMDKILSALLKVESNAYYLDHLAMLYACYPQNQKVQKMINPKFDKIISNDKIKHILTNSYPELETLATRDVIDKDSQFEQIQMHFLDQKKLKKNITKISRSESRFQKILDKNGLTSFLQNRDIDHYNVDFLDEEKKIIIEINGKYHYNNEYLFKDLEEKKLFTYVDNTVLKEEAEESEGIFRHFDFKNKNKFEYLCLKGYRVFWVDSWLLHLEVEGKSSSKEIEKLIKEIKNK